jgi:ribosomal protein S27E
MLPTKVSCEECGASVEILPSIPVYEMALRRDSHLATVPKSWYCEVNCPACGQRTQYVARTPPHPSTPISVLLGRTSRH